MGCSNIVRLTPPNLLGRKAEEIKAITVAECRERRRGMDGKPDLVPPLLPPLRRARVAFCIWAKFFCELQIDRGDGSSQRVRQREPGAGMTNQPDVGQFDCRQHGEASHAERHDAAEPASKDPPGEHSDSQADHSDAPAMPA